MTKQLRTAQFGPVLMALPDDFGPERWHGLPHATAVLARRAAGQIDAGDLAEAGASVSTALRQAPQHPEVLRLLAVLMTNHGDPQRAIDLLRHVLALRPHDMTAHNDLGDALRTAGDIEAAYVVWRAACETRPDSAAAWFNLGWNLDNDQRSAEARVALQHAVKLAPGSASVRLVLADLLVTLGEFDDAAAEYRAALQIAPDFGEAWCSLANITKGHFDSDEIARMEQLDRSGDVGEQAHAALEFALGQAYEDGARHHDAFQAYARANARMRAMRPWDAMAFDTHVDEVLTAFASPVARADEPDLGREAIFIVGMPRSGTTLVEQILATHPQVEGADELPDLMQVVREESSRRGVLFPEWVSAATPADWTRLGRRYLELTVRWRRRRPWFTDKQPYNWLLVGAAQAMLPGARIVACRRDPVETCWSCYRQIFPQGAAFSYELEHVARFYKAHDRALRFWMQRNPQRMREQVYETLIADQQDQTRALLDFCGLDFDPACLQFHRTVRSVRTASAAQVRQPLRGGTARAHAYGELLTPLRRLLA